MYILIQFVLLAISFVILERGADWLVEGSSSLAKRFKVSDLFIGLTIVAFGTSAPEFAVSVLAAINHSGGIAIGNVIGSNITNIALVLGVSFLVGGSLIVKKQTLRYEMPLMLIAQLSATMMLLKDGYLDYHDGIVLLCLMVIFLVYAFSTSKEGFVEEVNTKSHGLIASSLLALVGLIGVTAGGELGVYSAVNLARSFKVSETLIATTIVAFGTSVPELATSVKASIKSKSDLALGNIIGSNLFNILGVLGVASFISPIKPDRSVNVDLIFMNAIGVLLFLLFLNKKRKTVKWKGLILLLSYTLYIAYGIFLR